MFRYGSPLIIEGRWGNHNLLSPKLCLPYIVFWASKARIKKCTGVLAEIALHEIVLYMQSGSADLRYNSGVLDFRFWVLGFRV